MVLDLKSDSEALKKEIKSDSEALKKEIKSDCASLRDNVVSLGTDVAALENGIKLEW